MARQARDGGGGRETGFGCQARGRVVNGVVALPAMPEMEAQFYVSSMDKRYILSWENITS